MDIQELSRAGDKSRRLPGIVRPVRRLLFHLMYPYFAAIVGELTALQRQLEARETFSASDVRAIRNRLADLEDRLALSRPSE
jgi:hypothetical protein